MIKIVKKIKQIDWWSKFVYIPKRNKKSESWTNTSQFYFSINSVFRESKLLLLLILTYPITSNEAERSASLHTSRRTTMGEQRLNNLMLMGAHRSRLSEISNAILIDKFNGKQRMVTFAGDTVIEDDENWEDNTLNLLLIFFIQNYLWNLTIIF